MFMLTDPIFWINKTLATFERMIVKLQKYIEKCEAEVEANTTVISGTNEVASEKRAVVEQKALEKVNKVKTKADDKISVIKTKAKKQTMALATRNRQLNVAKHRAETTARNLNRLTGEQDE